MVSFNGGKASYLFNEITMIKISIDGKTYEMIDGDSYLVGVINYFIKSGDLEEVKEDKEPLIDLSKIQTPLGNPLYRDYLEWKNTSILEKLREELERRRDEYNECESTPYNVNSKQIFTEIIALLTSLENSSDIPNSCEEVWTPTPWEEIEVKNDDEDWVKRTFAEMDTGIFKYKTKEKSWLYSFWQYARSILPDSKDDIKLPEYKNENIYDPESPRSVEMHKLTTQVELLTNAVNKLISK